MVETTDKVAPADVDYSERALRDYLSKRRTELQEQRGETVGNAVWRIRRLTSKALSETNAVWWSGYEKQRGVENPGAFAPPKRKSKLHPSLIRKPSGRRWLDRHLLESPWNPPSLRKSSRPWGRGGARRHVGPTPPPKAEHKCQWIDTSTVPALWKQYDRHTQTWTWNPAVTIHQSIAGDQRKAERFLASMQLPVRRLQHTSWPVVMMATSLRDSIARMVRGEAKLASKSGRPGYLACATLGALLDKTPEQIADFLTNYRRACGLRRPRPRPSQ